jgi:endonuclease III
MKKEAQYAHRIKQLIGKLKKAGGSSELWEGEDPMELLLWAILSNYASESRAAAAVARLQAAMADYNELRVTSIAEIVEIIGADYPMCRPAAEEISRTLQAIFNRLHHLDLEFLKTGAKRTAEAFVSNLDGAGPHAKAMMVLRCLKGHTVPLDVNMFAFLQKSGCIPKDAPIEQAEKLLASVVKERETASIYTMLKRHAAAHAPRKQVPARSAPAAVVAVKPEPVATEEATKIKAKAKAVEGLKERAAASIKTRAASERKAAKAKAASAGKSAASSKSRKTAGGSEN